MPEPEKKAALAPDAAAARRYYTDGLIMLSGPVFMAVALYRIEAAVLIAVAVASAVACEALGALLLKGGQTTVRDLSAVFTGAAIALMLPAGASPLLAAAGSVFAVCAAKLPFGGAMHAPFVPAAAGLAFLCVSWPQKVFSYGGVSVAAMLQVKSSIRLNPLNFFDLVLGNYPGPMGTGCIAVLLACSAYFLIRRRKALWAPLGFLAACAAMAALFPRVYAGRLTSVAMELSSGAMVFAAVFLLPDPASAPSGRASGFVYGIFAGVVCMLLRRFGAAEEGVFFAVLIANAFSAFPLPDIAGRFGLRGRFAGLAGKGIRKGGAGHAV
ncbi:MAG TPA: RnfABCDGE type electron transport complex subunit D [Clostridiales bacterium]|nr:RnfABCDGE type electron transport complex subunit D [Clostridiales bacterium]HQH64039.1 RnfABCDGE type electron transport complex subunit D [Clostridiales bacterium]HQK72664.1 RnfABCDGE type electron transport complex subunit D [Clostridiales bacterium]